MEILIQSTKEFERDLAGFSQVNKDNIIEQINKVCQLILHEPETLFQKIAHSQFQKIKLDKDYDSSLYFLRLKPAMRLILTIDDDPIFDRKLITLFRIVKPEDAAKAYSSVAEILYQDFTIENQEVEVHSS
ncbi:hypothetical protein I8748_30975 [Nostoc sp. CENA67]|uniref:Uncharacterized protein n=1 Tax=Amazonocrinis nigriterrae CENA67 TaxID=2794033 RepID=A0A8J7LEA4_9NOST|nr:hypothetical protein [Amazonocrinis nigriterrae]MBH8566526.1 hypothetical protein [Amazonocrinis nigriterrae CENA67]